MDIAQFQLAVPLTASCIADHFPGRPLVPGASLCAALAAAIEARSGRAVRELAKLRFSAPVSPGEMLAARWERRSEDGWRIRLEGDRGEVLRGMFTLDMAEPHLAAGRTPGDLSGGTVPAREDPALRSGPVGALYGILPHGPSMQLLSDTCRWDAESLVAIATGHRDANHPLRMGGRLHPLVGLEYAAQCCGLHGAALGRLSGAAAAATGVAVDAATNSHTAASNGIAGGAGGTGRGAGVGRGATVVATVQQLRLSGGDLDTAGPVLRVGVRCVLRQQHSAAYECTVGDALGWSMEATLGLMLVPDLASPEQ